MLAQTSPIPAVMMGYVRLKKTRMNLLTMLFMQVLQVAVSEGVDGPRDSRYYIRVSALSIEFGLLRSGVRMSTNTSWIVLSVPKYITSV